MPTAITYTIGADASRHYSSLNNFEADWGVGISDDLVTDDEIWTVELWNDDASYIVETDVVDCSAVITDATRTITLKPASGTGAAGDPNDPRTRAATDALIDDPAVGAAIQSTETYNAFLDVGVGGTDYWYFEGLQLYISGNKGGGFGLNTGMYGSVDDCIIRQDHLNGRAPCVVYCEGGHVRNTIAITNNPNYSVFTMSYSEMVIENCTAVYVGSSWGTKYGFQQGSGGPNVIRNCVAVGFINGGTDYGFNGSFSAGSDYNASEGSSAPGSNSLDLTGDATDHFVNPVVTSSGDYRLKSGNELEGAGVTIAGISTDIRGVSYASPPAIGCCEADPSSGFSGTSALTLSSLTVSGSGTNDDPGYSGASAIALSSLVPAAAGTNTDPVFSGSSALALSSAAVVAAGTNNDPGFSGSSALALSSLVPAAIGTNTDPVYSGSSALALSSAILAAAGTNNDPGFQGASALVLSSLVAAAAGTNTDPVYSGAAALTLASAILAAAGTNNDPGYQGASALTLSSLVAAAAGTYAAPDRTGASALTLASAILAAAGTNNDPGNQGQIALALASLVPASAGTYTPPDRTGASAILLGALSASAAGTVLPPVFSGSIGQELSPLDLAAAGLFSSGASGGSIAQVLSSLELGFVGDYTPPPIAGAVALDLASLVFGIVGTLDPLLPTYARLVTLERVSRTLTLDPKDRAIRLD